MQDHENRSRLVLVAPDVSDPQELGRLMADALSGGDVASVILPQRAMDESLFQKVCSVTVPIVQAAGAAALVAGDSRIAGRVKADGMFISGGSADIADAIERHAPAMIIGGGNARDRHSALAIGEAAPDFIFFGGLDRDIKPEPHGKNVALAEWWAAMIDIPCILMGGSDPAHAVAMAGTGAEFIAFCKAVFETPGGAGEGVRAINAALDEKAPRFDQQ